MPISHENVESDSIKVLFVGINRIDISLKEKITDATFNLIIELASTIKEAVNSFKIDSPDVAVVYDTEQMNTATSIEYLLKYSPDTKVIVISNNNKIYSKFDAIQDGAAMFFESPCDDLDLIEYIRRFGVAAQKAKNRTKESTEKVLMLSQNELLQHFQKTPLGVIKWGMDFDVKYWNPGAEKIFGYSSDQAMGKRADKLLIAEEAREYVDEIWESLLEQEGGLHSTNRNVRKNGEKIICEWKNSPIIDEVGKVTGVVSIVQDITERKTIERTLLKEIAFSKTILDSTPAYFVSIDKHGTLININKSMLKVLEYTFKDLEGQNYLKKLVPEEDHDSLNKVFGQLVEKKSTINVNNILTKKGKKIVVEWYGAPILDEKGDLEFFVGFGIDITEKQKLESRLQQSYKMEAIGTLAGGIAHDFNNMLGVIIGNTEILLDKMDESEDDELFDILAASKRAKEMIGQIMTFSRKNEQIMSSVDIGAIIKETINFMRSTIPTTIKIRSNIEESIGEVFANETQINQVLMNLCTNAAHVMKEEGGVMDISLRKGTLNLNDAKSMGLDAGVYQHLSVTDTGSGMDKELLERIFDPYFTTKKTGEGTGMGLSVVYGIVKDHNGGISVNSEPGIGTTFNIYFPLMDSTQAEQSDLSQISPIKGNMEKILFVDDEVLIAKMSTEILKKLGYQVESKTSSIEALETFKANPYKFDLLITDMTMPNMTGVKLTSEIHKINPEIPVILCTGFSSSSLNEENAKTKGISAIIIKPVRINELGSTIRKVLDKKN